MAEKEVRSCRALREAKRKNEPVEKIIFDYLECLKSQKFSKENFQELIIVVKFLVLCREYGGFAFRSCDSTI